MIQGVIRRMLPYKDIETVEHIETPLSVEMENALELWHDMYIDKSPWLGKPGMSSLNLAALISSEIARQVTLEMKWNITGTAKDADGEILSNPRADYLKEEFAKCIAALRKKLEQGCAAGGMTIKPYPKDGHIYFDWGMDWTIYPIAFDDDGYLADVIFRDTYTQGKTYYTRLERHTVDGDNVKITQRAFKSNMADSIGTEIALTEVEQWKTLVPEATVTHSEGQMFGWFKVAAANNVDVDSPMGASVFSKAISVIKQADIQYSRILWEFEGSELAIDVDPTVFYPKKDGKGGELPKLNQRLFRAVDTGADGTYNVFSPPIRDNSLINGLNQLLMRIEDLCGLARGTISIAAAEARTATELNILKQRTYTTIADNQAALETCLKDVIRAMDKYATLYNLAPEGEYDVSFEWDDSIITDTTQQLGERIQLLNAGCMGKAEIRQWYLGETESQAKKAITDITQEQIEQMQGLESVMPRVTPEDETPPEE